MRIGELAYRAGVSVRALRYYEEQELLIPERTASGQRVYTEEAVERVRIFQLFYAAGLGSRTIAKLLPCIDTGRTTPTQRDELLAERGRLAGNIATMTNALHRLDDLITAADQRTEILAAGTGLT
ncbi:MerR family transcriptional regulator [Nocardia sp. NPDC088792]|uniref:MerR family transcriptional regulator n=1 Tax=Nocardia sp. NPDC088792 TaxID=3364332 RepID=UPI0037F9A99E